jgi:deazaflavin-dependent oxidoreductase (nitroreductase family)
MPIPKAITRFNKMVTNRISRQFAGHVPWFAILIHRGRTSGKEYRTPINAFPTTEGFAIALTYGRDTDWVKNVIASGGCTLEYRGKTVQLTEPQFGTIAEKSDRFPTPVRFILGLLDVDQHILLRRTS